MANCTKCGRDVGCSCNLSGGICADCLNSAVVEVQNQITREQIAGKPNA